MVTAAPTKIIRDNSNGVKPRILIFSLAYEPLVGGAELAVKYITDHIFDFEFDLITCRFDRSHKFQEKIGNVNVYRVGFGSRLGRYLYPIYAYRLAAKLHRQNPYQLVWAIMAAYAGGAAVLFKRHFSEVKYLLTLQEGDPIEHIHKRVRGFRSFWQQSFTKADNIQAISNFLGDWAKTEGATCPVAVVPNGVDLHNFQFSIHNFQPSSDGKIFKIITTSRLVPKNAVDVLIQAVHVIASETKQSQKDRHGAEVPRDDVKIKLQVLGVGSEEKKLKQMVQDLGLQDIVEFHGIIQSGDLPKHLASADIFVRPSRSEGLGTAFLEAMAVGLPIIGTSVGGIPDFLDDLVTGLFCKVDDPKDLAEKIKTLIDDPELRKKLSANGRKLVEEKYNWDKIALQMEEIFGKL